VKQGLTALPQAPGQSLVPACLQVEGFSEAIQFSYLYALSLMVGLKVDFDLQITLMGSSLYRLLAERIGREYS
jgi:hypothetical protein